jgi:hypothetical protein
MKTRMKPDDPDLREAGNALDSEFPGAVYDASLVHFIAQKKKARRFKKRLLTVLVKFFCFAGAAFWLTDGIFPLSFLEYLTVAAGAAVFAVVPLNGIVEEAVKGRVGRK